MEEWREYKLAVPTFGAIIINPFLDKVLLVQGYMAKSSWGFPKGKVNEDEPAHLCAAREVLEETGFDVGPLLEENEYLEQVINDQTVRLYLITGVPESTSFAPQTRCEIRDLQWFEINTLPMNRSDMVCKNKLGIAANSFFMVIPFVRELKMWVKNKQRERMESQNMDGRMRTKIAERLKKKPDSLDRAGKWKADHGGVARQNSGKKNNEHVQSTGKQRKDSEKNASMVGRQRKESEDRNLPTNAKPPVGRQRKESEKNLCQSTGGKQKNANKKNSRAEIQDDVNNAMKNTEQIMASRFWAAGEKGTTEPIPWTQNEPEGKQARRQLFMSLVPPSKKASDTKTGQEGRKGKKKSCEEEKPQLFKPIFDENFCPTAWAKFSLNYEEIMEPYDMPTSVFATEFMQNRDHKDDNDAESSLKAALGLHSGLNRIRDDTKMLDPAEKRKDEGGAAAAARVNSGKKNYALRDLNVAVVSQHHRRETDKNRQAFKSNRVTSEELRQLNPNQ